VRPFARTRPLMRTFVVAVAWLAAVAGAVGLVFAGSAGTSLTGSGFFLPYAGLALAVVANAGVGAVLTLRRPGNVIGRLQMLAATLIPVTFVGFTVGAVLAQERGRHDILAGLVALIFALGIVPTFIVVGRSWPSSSRTDDFQARAGDGRSERASQRSQSARQRWSCVRGRSGAASRTTRSA
jgi:hypothetical protein